ncbi:MAG: DUF2156 domain-containing protein, partial [Spirochaetes bacterium]|nr:DUF2156 domain-containing protein [Spirochaetota bacterium]
MNLVFKNLFLEDRELINDFFKKHPPLISEYTFSNLFVWQKSRKIQYALYEEGLIFLAVQHGKSYFMPPVGFSNIKKVYFELINYAEKHNFPKIFKRVSENDMKQLGDDKSIKITEDENNHDYVYNTEKMAFLEGRKYSNKRAWVRKFEGEYYHKYMDYTEECKERCIKLAEDWVNKRKEKESYNMDEFEAIKCFLENYKYFKIPGGIICVDCEGKKEIVAFTFGEKLNKDTFVIHFEKADSDFIGIYQAINKYFAENEIAGKFKYINREQDLGLAGLKKAKHSYYPEKFIKKYIIE